MTDEELQLNNLINDCSKFLFCPLYSAFWNKPNAQGEYRREQYKWAKKCYPKKFKIGDKIFGAKLALIMESPPPKYSDYFYGPKGESKKLFSNIAKNLMEIEGIPAGLENKTSVLEWIAKKGLVIIDAAKCRMKITPENSLEQKEPLTDKITASQISKSYDSCAILLKLQLQVIRPYKIAIGIASVYDHYINNEPYLLRILREIGLEDGFIKKRTVSVFDRRGEGEFNEWFKDTWMQIKEDLSKQKIEYI